MFARIVVQLIIFFVLGSPFLLLERKFAAHNVEHRKVVVRDLGALVLVALLGIPAGNVVTALQAHLSFLAVLRAPALPAWASVPLAIVGSDFAMYWTHRLIHTAPLWRVHRWHHAPGHMYWMAGGRTSFLQNIVYTIPVSVFLVMRVPAAIMSSYAFFGIVLNHWMHANLRIRSRWLEAIIVTPRMHHVHHSVDPRHHGRNFGSLFSFWDRMFGTYFSPDDVTDPLSFGIPESVPAAQLAVGL